MWHRKHRYMRLDGSSKISARRDMVADFQSRADIFVLSDMENVTWHGLIELCVFDQNSI